MLRQAQQCFPQLSRRVQLEKFLLEDCQVSVIEVKLELQRVVGDAPTAVEPGENLVEHGEKV